MLEYNHLTFPLDFDSVSREKQLLDLPTEMAEHAENYSHKFPLWCVELGINSIIFFFFRKQRSLKCCNYRQIFILVSIHIVGRVHYSSTKQER